jgi:hypothetical protein
MRTSKPPQIWHGGSSNKHGRSHKEDGSVNIFVLNEAARLKRGGAYAVNALLTADRPHNRCLNHLRLWLLAFGLGFAITGVVLLTAQLALGCSWTNLKAVKDVRARLLMHYLTPTFDTTARSCKK